MSGQAIKKVDNSPAGAIVPGTYRDARLANELMETARQHGHLISPATSVGAMPEGCCIALSKVEVDLSKNDRGYYISNDTYDVGGKRGLSKTVLQKLGGALGVSWDPVASGRVDDGSDPYYCCWKAVGKYRSFDGQIQVIVGEKEMDLREDSAQVQALWQRYEDGKNKTPPAKKPDGQIREMRLHIQSHAETKAQLRALRSMGIKTSYDAAELQKPFVAARVMFTGQTNDPELKRMFAEKVADSFLDANRSLYSTGAPVTHATQPVRLSPPPVGSVPADDEDDGYADDRGGVPPQQEQREASPSQAQPSTTASGHLIPGGNSKGTPIEDASDRDLEYWSNRIAGDLAEGKSRNPSRDAPLQKAMADELAKRQGAGPGGEY